MDITAKRAAPDKNGVRIAELDEESFRYLLWDHKPLTDFWMTGPGTVKRLEKRWPISAPSIRISYIRNSVLMQNS